MIDNKPENKGLFLAGKFLEVSGFDGDDEDTPSLIPVKTVDRITSHPDDKEKTAVIRKDGYTDAYINKPFDQVRRDLS